MYSYKFFIYFLRCVNISISLSNRFVVNISISLSNFYDLILIHTDRCVTSVMTGSFLPTFRRLSRLFHILENLLPQASIRSNFHNHENSPKKTKKKRETPVLAESFFPTFSVLKCLSRLVHILEKRSPSGKE